MEYLQQPSGSDILVCGVTSTIENNVTLPDGYAHGRFQYKPDVEIIDDTPEKADHARSMQIFNKPQVAKIDSKFGLFTDNLDQQMETCKSGINIRYNKVLRTSLITAKRR